MSQSLPRILPPAAALLSVLVCMVLPMLLIRHFFAQPGQGDVETSVGATVALGAIFRAGGRTMLRSTVMSAARTVTRAMTRRIMRSFLPVILRIFLPSARVSAVERYLSSSREQSMWLALVLGMATLGASFYGVVALSEGLDRDRLLGGLALEELALLATAPLLVHIALMKTIGGRVGVRVSLNTRIDGILLQAYFTGACSYLPLASDIETAGDPALRARCAAGVLGGLLGIHTLCALLGQWSGSLLLLSLGSHVLLYAFVLSFPLPPLDGSDIWAHSRWGWLAIWLATLGLFLSRMPEAFYDIL